MMNPTIRTFLKIARRAFDMGKAKPAHTFLFAAAHAIRSPRAEPPLHHYALRLGRALRAMHGSPRELATAPQQRRQEALADWRWYAITFAGHMPYNAAEVDIFTRAAMAPTDAEAVAILQAEPATAAAV